MSKNKKYEYLIFFVAFLGILTLFFFPEPQTNFIYYVATAVLFGVIIVLLIKRRNKGTKS
jgi:uncharacterized membrane protein YbhN (UPF0104 family)